MLTSLKGFNTDNFWPLKAEERLSSNYKPGLTAVVDLLNSACRYLHDYVVLVS